ncbi:hypothetical protein PGTUg99_028705 [Puccinia graminis f. sp. tritici]|uniref:Uncharacterized protein n=1 Tax=Puccinia graminis f. sp. tritici TaxID=56615 RepID=A0A5B0MHC4_PUCGR|nr:hypothetical protein PGTUg99_028705 [Puccinia graminis f. sp. tritici]
MFSVLSPTQLPILKAPSNNFHKTPPTCWPSSLPASKPYQSTAKAPSRTSPRSYTDCHPQRPSPCSKRSLSPASPPAASQMDHLASTSLADTTTVLHPTLTASQSDPSSTLLVNSRMDSSTIPPPPPLPQPKTASQPATPPDPLTAFPTPSPYLTISVIQPASTSTLSDVPPPSLAAKIPVMLSSAAVKQSNKKKRPCQSHSPQDPETWESHHSHCLYYYNSNITDHQSNNDTHPSILSP